MNRTLTLKTDTRADALTAKARPLARIGRTVAQTWDTAAVIGLMASTAAYGFYAVTQMTGF